MEQLMMYLPLALLIIEFFLGATNLVKANSTVELALNILAKIIKAILPKDEESIKIEK